MNRIWVLFIAVLLGGIFISASVSSEKVQDLKYPHSRVMPQESNPSIAVKKVPDFGKIPLYFIRNKGQVDRKARFYAKASRYTLWLTGEGLVFDSVKPRSAESRVQSERLNTSIPHSPKIERDVSRLLFVGSARNPGMVPIDESKLKVNYFIGNDKSKWHCDVPTSMAVLYKSLYKNIDLKVYGKEKQIEYDWIVKPGGNPLDIKFKYKSVKGTRIDEQGNLLIETDFGELMHRKPVSYQEKGNEKIRVKTEFKRIAENTYGFEVGKYDRSRELIIDPVVLAYSTYLGGGGFWECGWGIAVDIDGNVYVVGHTSGSDFPTLNQYQTNKSRYDVFVTKLDPTQSGAASLLYSTYLGGNGHEYGRSIAVDHYGNIYVTGDTYSTDFPILNQYQSDPGDGLSNVFVSKLDPTQSGTASLLYSTYLGGGSFEIGYGIAVDGNGYIYVTGYTESTDFPILNEFQTDQPSPDVFVTKLNPFQSGASSLLYSTYLGGGAGDRGYGIDTDDNGIAYVTGRTYSSDFPILNHYQTYQGDCDVFITKLDPGQSGADGLLYSTYLGGGRNDIGCGIARDGNGHIYVAGNTYGSDFPTLNHFQVYQGGGDLFVSKLDMTQSGATGLLYSTYLGGGDSDICNGIAVDGNGNAYVTGYTNSTDFPTLNEYRSNLVGEWDVFVSKLDPTQSGTASLLYSTYLGGSKDEYCEAVAADAEGNMYVTGAVNSSDFPTHNEYQTDQILGDVFVCKLSPSTPMVKTNAVSNITQTTASSGGNVTSNGGAAVTARGVCWNSSPNPTTADSHTTNGTGTGRFTSSITGLTPGTTYFVRAYAVNSAGTSYGNSRTFTTTYSIVPPTVTTTAVLNITSTTASCGGNVTSNGGAVVTARGVCWSTNLNPTTTDSHTTDGTGTGPFTSPITGLTPNSTYHVRAYAVNSAGTAYGNELTFTTSEPPVIELNRTGLNFGAIIGGPLTGSQDFLIGNSGGGTVSWTASASDEWIVVNPTTGTGAGLIIVSINPTGLAIGTHTGTISISDSSAANSPQTVSITFNLYSSGTTNVPFGEFSTPVAGSSLRGSIPVTGWALDDVEACSVKIYRDGNVYIGDAVFVEGARPDVESTYPEYPFNYRAVWGYQMLTNFLPNGGNGSISITAVAADGSGHKVTLGTKTIVCDNANADKPFGAIDTPTQGGDASGSCFVNFGWALTPQPNTISTDGSTIKVWVDGVPLTGNPTYNLYREDIAVTFPGYNNSAGAVGYYFINTMGYTNGMHTIAWSVEDNGGNAEGIGSRYFRVINIGNPPSGSASIPGCGLKGEFQNIPVSFTPIYLNKGYKTGVESEQQTETISPDKDGIINVEIMEDERIEIKVGKRYRGYLLVDDQLRGLPVGSTMDVEKGVFYWQPGPGFLGEYQFVFVGKNPDGQWNMRNIDFFIRPKH